MAPDTLYFIGVDDTDFGDSIGTGAFARELTLHLAQTVGATPLGVTRHQFLIHPEIPYTTHNSSACIGITCSAGLKEIRDVCRQFIRFLFHPGADPGLSIAQKHQLNDSLLSFGQRAQKEVVTKKEALQLATDSGVLLEEHGGAGIGVIGALSGCALRMDGNDGRFISLRGIRLAKPTMTVGALKSLTPIERVMDPAGHQLETDDTIKTNRWVRPVLKKNQIVLTVDRNGQDGSYFIKKVPKPKAN